MQVRPCLAATAAGALVLVVLMSFAGCPAPRPATQADTGVAAATPAAAPADAPQEGSTVAWQLTSSAFAHGKQIPKQHTADGEDVSPALAWTPPPEGTQQLALLCDDPDAPVGTWNHWVAYGLAPTLTALPQGGAKTPTVATPALLQGKNSFGKVGYNGPAPPPGKPHRYQFTLYALKQKLSLQPGASRQQLLDAMEGSVIARTMLEGLYGR